MTNEEKILELERDLLDKDVIIHRLNEFIDSAYVIIDEQLRQYDKLKSENDQLLELLGEKRELTFKNRLKRAWLKFFFKITTGTEMEREHE